MSQPNKKPRRKLVLQIEEEDEENTDFDDPKKLKVAIHKRMTNIDEICKNIRTSARLLGFKFIKYE